MKTIKNLPFYSNTSDGTHCFQAGLKMILKYFIPDKDFSFEELDKITMKKDGLWTWPMAALIWMQENGFEVVDIEPFDYKRFVADGGKYLIEGFGKEMGEAQVKNSDIEQERKLSKLFLEKVKIQKRTPHIVDITKLIDSGYVIAVNINSRTLNGKEGYVGHFVVIKGYDDKNIFLNDPGLPGKENAKIAFDIFEKSWSYPDEKAKNIMAFKLNL